MQIGALAGVLVSWHGTGSPTFSASSRATPSEITACACEGKGRGDAAMGWLRRESRRCDACTHLHAPVAQPPRALPVCAPSHRVAHVPPALVRAHLRCAVRVRVCAADRLVSAMAANGEEVSAASAPLLRLESLCGALRTGLTEAIKLKTESDKGAAAFLTPPCTVARLYALALRNRARAPLTAQRAAPSCRAASPCS